MQRRRAGRLVVALDSFRPDVAIRVARAAMDRPSFPKRETSRSTSAPAFQDPSGSAGNTVPSPGEVRGERRSAHEQVRHPLGVGLDGLGRGRIEARPDDRDDRDVLCEVASAAWAPRRLVARSPESVAITGSYRLSITLNLFALPVPPAERRRGTSASKRETTPVARRAPDPNDADRPDVRPVGDDGRPREPESAGRGQGSGRWRPISGVRARRSKVRSKFSNTRSQGCQSPPHDVGRFSATLSATSRPCRSWTPKKISSRSCSAGAASS